MKFSKFCLSTETGKNVDIQNPSIDMIDLVDISTSLSLLVRGNGHSGKLSIAQHSLMTAWYVTNNLHTLPQEERCAAPLYALLHDAAEAYTSDLPTPFKNYLKHCLKDQFICVASELLSSLGYEDEKMEEIIAEKMRDSQCVFENIEQKIDAAIFAAFSLNKNMPQKTKDLVKQGDKVAMAYEMRDVCSIGRSKLIGCNGYDYPEVDRCYSLTIIPQKECKDKFEYFVKEFQKICSNSCQITNKADPNMDTLLKKLEKSSGLVKQCPLPKRTFKTDSIGKSPKPTRQQLTV